MERQASWRRRWIYFKVEYASVACSRYIWDLRIGCAFGRVAEHIDKLNMEPSPIIIGDTYNCLTRRRYVLDTMRVHGRLGSPLTSGVLYARTFPLATPLLKSSQAKILREDGFRFARCNLPPQKLHNVGVTEIRGLYYRFMGKSYLTDVLETMRLE
jgi:hypothetical protein